jgi:hypothetical protein
MELEETFVKYVGWSANNELERLWKDVVTGFDILSWHLSGTAKESHENPVRRIAATWANLLCLRGQIDYSM